MAPRTQEPIERFIRRIAERDGPDGCDLWTGQKTKGGYGQFALRHGKLVLAHRWWYEVVTGTEIGDKQLDHLCRVPSCVRASHLEPVTARENTLRGFGPTARNAKKTHCPRGHAYDIEVPGGRWCSMCKHAAWRAWDDRRRATLQGQGA